MPLSGVEPAASILVVDDRPDKRMAIAAMLDGGGWDLHLAESAESGLRELLQREFAVILLDVNMPTMNGFEMAELVRQRPKTRYIPIIFITAENNLDEHIRKGYSLGAIDYLIQPVLPEFLRAKVEVFVDLHMKGRLLQAQQEELHRLREAETARRLGETRMALGETQQRLLEALKLEAVGKLAGGVAHEFNNLMMGILGFSRMAMESLSEGHGARACLDVVLKNAEQAARVTSELLAFSQKQFLAPKVLELNDFCARLGEEAKGRLPGLALAVHGSEAPAFVNADPERLEQSVQHLLRNAAEAMPGGGPVRLRVRPEERPQAAPGGWVALDVEDEGMGMDAETAQRCFDPFFTTKGMGKASGLGLSMVHGFVQQSGGRVELRSERSRGTCVSLFFPRVAAIQGLRGILTPG